MKLKKLELTAVEFFERVINGEKLYLNDKNGAYAKLERTEIGIYIAGQKINTNAGGLTLSKNRTVWIEQQWYEDIPDQGVLCWTNDSKEDTCLIFGYHEGSSTCRFSAYSKSYKLPIPLTPEEITRFLPAEPVTKYDESNWAENPSIEFPVLCHVSDGNPGCKIAGCKSRLIVAYHDGDRFPFVGEHGQGWKYAIPVDE